MSDTRAVDAVTRLFERVADLESRLASVERALGQPILSAVPVLGTKPVSPPVAHFYDAVKPEDLYLGHLSPADRESARRLNEALEECEHKYRTMGSGTCLKCGRRLGPGIK